VTTVETDARVVGELGVEQEDDAELEEGNRNIERD
jgi:hypothetical protein